ncbi:MAG: TonB-dependent receptor, partial [Pseudomonadota bacterium]
RPLARDATQDATVVDGNQLRDSSRPSTLEAVSQRAADVYVSGRGAIHGVASGASGGIHIRGLGGSPSSQVLVVEDGVPDFQGIFGHPIPDAYVPFLTDEVAVIKGGDSVLYGTNAMGGVVVLRNRWRDRPGYEIVGDSAFGSYATLRETVSALARFESWDAAAAFHALSTDGHRIGAGGKVVVGTIAARYRFGPDLKLALRNKAVHLTGGDPGSVTHPYADHWYDVWRDNASLQLDWRRGAARFNVISHGNLGLHRLYDGFHATDHVGGGQAELDLAVHRTTRLVLGIEAKHVGGEVTNRITGEQPAVRGIADLSLYHQLSLDLFDRFDVVLGARELFSTEYGFVFLYKGGARWRIRDDLAIRARFARNYRQPTIRELYLPFPTANPTLRPEVAHNTDLGASYSSPHLELSCAGYRTAAENLIKYFGVWPSAEVVNIGHATVWGVEGALAVKRIGPVSIFLTGNWQDVGRHTRQNPSAKANLTIDASHHLGAHSLAASLGGEWVHGLYMADYSRHPIDDVWTIDLTVRHRYGKAGSKPGDHGGHGGRGHGENGENGEHHGLGGLGGRGGLAIEPYLVLRNVLNRSNAYVEGYTMPGFNVLVGLRLGSAE